MPGNVVPLGRELALRVHAVADLPLSSGRRRRAPARYPRAPVGHRMLCVTMDDEERGARPFELGMFRVRARERGGVYEDARPLRLTEPMEGVVLGDALARADRARARVWARRHGLRVLGTQAFVHEVFLREVLFEGALAAAWDWGVLFGSLATRGGRSSSDPDTFSFTLCPLFRRTRTRRHHSPSRHPRCPSVRVRRLTEPYVQTVEFTATQTAKKFPGRFLGLHEKAAVLSAESHTLASACRMLGLASPSAPAGSSIEGRLDALRIRLDAVCGFAEAASVALLQHRAVVSSEHEGARARRRPGRLAVGEVHTPAALGRAYLAAMGVSAPPRVAVTPELGLSVEDVLGASMAAFFPGHTRVFARNIPTPGVLADLGRQYPTVASNMGQWAWWTADHVEARDDTNAIRTLLAHATPEDYLARAPWGGLNALVLFQPRGDWLPVRFLAGEGRRQDEIVLDAPLTVPERLGPAWITLPDVLISTWRRGRPPEVLQVIRFVPVGRREGLRSVVFGAEGALNPRRDLFAQLVDLRGRLAAEGSPHLAQAAKVLGNVLAFGATAELHPERVRRVTLYDGVRRRTLRTRYEKPGPYYCPPLAALVTGGGRLQLFLLEHLARAAGGRCAMVAVDSAFLTGPDPLAIYRTVRDRMEPLNTSATMRPLLRLDPAHGDPPRVLTYHGAAISRYCVVEDRSARHLPPSVVKSSGQVLGSILDPLTHAKSHQGAGMPAWWAEAWRYSVGRNGRGHPQAPAWIDRLAPYVHTLTTPSEVARYGTLHGGARPFQQMLFASMSTNSHGGVSIAPLHLLTGAPDPRRPWADAWDPRALPWVDAQTGRPLCPAAQDDDEGRFDFLPQTYRSLLAGHLRHPDLKDPDATRRGWSTRTYTVTATGWRFRRKESVLPVGADDLGTLFGDEERDYEGADAHGIEEACRVLHACSPARLSGLADLLGVTPRRLQDVLSGRAHPRQELAGRLAALADQVRRTGGLPSRLDLACAHGTRRLAADEALRVLQAGGVHAREIARACKVSVRAVWAWRTGACPRGRTAARLIEFAQRIASQNTREVAGGRGRRVPGRERAISRHSSRRSTKRR
jgi:hypothetical protein